MNGKLAAEFSRKFIGGPEIHAAISQPARGFSVTALFGPSGCGKSTILRCLAGLDRPTTGTIHFDGQAWFDAATGACLTPQSRNVGLMFQDYALFPHLTVAENVGYGLRSADRDDRTARVTKILRRLQIGELADRFPHQISGGQQQRVALARSLAKKPRLLLLDEPLSALDGPLRDELRGALRRLLAEFEIPIVLVTHDRIEAVALADQIVVMEAGRVLSSGPVHEVFSRPKDLAVARIVGIETVQPGEIESVQDQLATVAVSGGRLLAIAPEGASRRVYVCIKGEDVALRRNVQDQTSVRNQLRATIRWITNEGPLIRIGLDCGFDLTALVTRPACEELGLKEGEVVIAQIKTSAIHLIPRD